MCETIVTVGFWNILAEGLSAGELMSPTMGEEVALWAWRGPLIVQTMSKMFEQCALIGVVENDKPQYLLRELRQQNPTLDIGCVHVIKGEYHNTNAYKFNMKQTSAEVWPQAKDPEFSRFALRDGCHTHSGSLRQPS